MGIVAFQLRYVHVCVCALLFTVGLKSFTKQFWNLGTVLELLKTNPTISLVLLTTPLDGCQEFSKPFPSVGYPKVKSTIL